MAQYYSVKAGHAFGRKVAREQEPGSTEVSDAMALALGPPGQFEVPAVGNVRGTDGLCVTLFI